VCVTVSNTGQYKEPLQTLLQIPAAVLGVESPVQKKYVLSGIAFSASMTTGGSGQ